MRFLSARRATVAVATAVACLAAMASPASATATAGSIDAASITVGTNPPVTFTIPGSGSDPCNLPTQDAEFVIDVTGSAPSRTTEITGINTSTSPNGLLKSTFTFNSTLYQLDLTLADPVSTGLSNSGSLAGSSSPYTIDQDVAFEGNIYQVTPPTCAKGDSVCNFFIQLNVDGNFVGTVSGGNALNGTVTNATGSGTAFTLSCAPVFASLDSAGVTVNDLDMTFPA